MTAHDEARPVYQCMCTDDDEGPGGTDLWLDVPERSFQAMQYRSDVRSRILYTATDYEALCVEVVRLRARVARIEAAARGMRFDVWDVPTEMRAKFDGEERIVVVQAATIEPLRAALNDQGQDNG